MADYLWSAVRQWGQRLGSALTFVILARILPAEQIGLVSMALAIMALAEVVNENGAAEAVIRHREAGNGAIMAVNCVNVGLSLVLAMALALGADRIEFFFATPGLAPVVRALSIVLLLNAFVYVPIGLMRRDMEFRQLALIALAATLVGSAIGIGGAFAGWGVWALVGQALGFAATNFMLLNLRRKARFAARPDFAAARPLLRFGGLVVLGNLLAFTATRAVELALPYHYGAAVLAAYIIGSRFYFVAAQMVSAVMLDVGMAHLSALQQNSRRFKRALLRSVEAGMLLGTAIFGGLAAIAPEFCALLFGKKGAAAWPYLMVMGVAGAPLLLNYIAQIGLKALGHAAHATAAMAIQAAGAALILLPDWPITPLARVAALNAIVALPLVLQWTMLSRNLRLPLSQLARGVLPAWMAGAAMLAVVWWLRPQLPIDWPLLNLALLITVGAAVYLPLAMLGGRGFLLDMLRQRRAQRAGFHA